jgi:predicted Zn-dependent protease
MKKIKYFLVVLVCAVSFLTCVESDPFGGSGFKLLPETALIASAYSSYSEFIDYSVVVDDDFTVTALTSKRNSLQSTMPATTDEEKQQKAATISNYNKAIEIASNSTKRAEILEQAKMVKRLGKDIKDAAQKWCDSVGKSGYLNGYAWECNLVVDSQVNAWCMPGGYIVVYTGILPVTKNEDALATVMGHEVAHALHNHGNQRVSQSLMLQLGLSAAQITLGVIGTDQQTTSLLMTGLGITSTLGVALPFSRDNESEADKTGLYLMAIAGYNPEESVPFWQRMAQLSGKRGDSADTFSEFFSTHPDSYNRQQALQKYIPEARRRAAQLKIDSIKENIPKAKKIAAKINGQ